jgi:hypothetical protein
MVRFPLGFNVKLPAPNGTLRVQLVTNKSQGLKVSRNNQNAFPIKNKVTNKK